MKRSSARTNPHRSGYSLSYITLIAALAYLGVAQGCGSEPDLPARVNGSQTSVISSRAALVDRPTHGVRRDSLRLAPTRGVASDSRTSEQSDQPDDPIVVTVVTSSGAPVSGLLVLLSDVPNGGGQYRETDDQGVARCCGRVGVQQRLRCMWRSGQVYECVVVPPASIRDGATAVGADLIIVSPVPGDWARFTIVLSDAD